MDIKIIATDLDGTLMAPDHESITPRTMSALVNAHQKGVKIAVSTGRTLSHIQSVYELIPFIDYIIYSNGAAAYDCKAKRTVFTRLIDSNRTEQLIEMLSSMDLFFNVYSSGKIYAKRDVGDFSDRADIPKDFLDHFIDIINPCDNIEKDLSGTRAEVIAAYYMDNADRNKIINKVESLGGLIHVSSIMDNIEIMSDKAGKGAALDALCKLIGCTADNAMAFGDASNDCSMLEYAYYSFAMANGDEMCKQSASFLTSSNGEDGVARAIEKYVL